MVQTPNIKQYQIIKQLGRGSFGTTYLVKDTHSFDELCVIKQLNPERVDLEAARKLFLREAQILDSLKEASQIPKFIAYFEDNGNYYIVEEYIEGTTLDNLTNTQWNSRQIIIFLWDILSILQTLHRNNIIHRDIKPSNLIQRKSDSKIVLIDFGAVKQLEDNVASKQKTCISTFGYAPPEQIIGEPRFNSDIYALGMTAIKLFAGIEPQFLRRNTEDDVIWREHCLTETSLIAILNKMVKTDPEQRYQSVEEVLKALNHSKEETIINQQPDDISGQETIVNPAAVETLVEDQPKKTKGKKKIYYLITAITLGIIATIEIVNPFIRPLYYRKLGDRALDKYQLETALKRYQTAIDLQRQNALAWKGRGDSLFRLGRHEGAIKAYDKALSIDPNNLKTLNSKGKTLYNLRQYQAALETHEQALEIEPESAEAWSGKGIAYIGLQKYEEAIKSFDKAQQIKPEQPTIWVEKAIALKYVEDDAAATKFYQEALDIYQEKINHKQLNSPLEWTNRGFILEQLGRPLDAFHSYDQALTSDPNFYEAIVGKAHALNKEAKYEEALTLFDKALEIRPNDYQVWFNKGNLLSQVLQQHEEALKAFEKSVQINSDFEPALIGKSLTLINLKQYPEALETLERILQLNPNEQLSWANKGFVLEELGKNKEALESYNQAVALGFTPAQEMQAQLQQKLGM